jgi:hypothetical protein
MAKVIKNELFESCAIVGLTKKEYLTLMEIMKKEANKAADPDNKEYDNDEKASKVLCLFSTLQNADLNPVMI